LTFTFIIIIIIIIIILFAQQYNRMHIYINTIEKSRTGDSKVRQKHVR